MTHNVTEDSRDATSLTLSNVPIDDEALEHVASSINQVRSIRSILRRCQFKDFFARANLVSGGIFRRLSLRVGHASTIYHSILGAAIAVLWKQQDIGGPQTRIDTNTDIVTYTTIEYDDL